ncbi:FH2 domain-containing protein 1-like isoform X5 [Columba livia]|uniref:FH2 domain-containing protein 1-like isoform X5 n=1 Tax=Columba livia TaxID=8932 RepID=UPI0031B9D734
MGSPRRPEPPPPPGPPPPAPPPPPGPPPPALPPPGPPPPPGERLRALHWEPLSPARVRGRHSVWAPRPPPPLDLPRLRLLFREPRGAAPGQRPAPAVRPPDPPDPPEPPRSPAALTPRPPQTALLEPKRSLALGVFLKQVKRPVRQIVQDIRDGVGAPYGAERLRELSRLLPGAAEVARLRSFPGGAQQLPEPELFMLLLTDVPSYARCLELLVLKEEFWPRLSALRGSIQTLTDAAGELLRCEELHTILHLVLSAGNHLNSGGYAGSAAGFRVSSLLKLPDTKGNEPGVDLLHFVAMEAARADPNLLEFPAKMPHVGPAARIDVSEVEAELRRLAGRLEGARGPGGPPLQPFLSAADEQLRGARDALQRMQRAAAAALEFYCEEAAPGGLRELCAVLSAFAGRLRAAAQENRAREQAQQRRQQLEQERLKRRSIATCSARDASPRPRGPFPLTPQPGRHGLRAPRPGPAPPGSPRPAPAPQGPPRPPGAPPALQRRHTAPELPEARGCAQGAPRDPAPPRAAPPGRCRPPRRPRAPLQPGRPVPGQRGPRGPGAPPRRPRPRPPAARRCSASSGAWRAGGGAGPPPAEGRGLRFTPVSPAPLLPCDNKR